MMNVLKKMSSLEELSVHSWIKEYFSDNDITDPDLDPQSTIVFLQLQLFKFTCNTLVKCARFIQLLSLLQTTCIHLHCISNLLAEAILLLSYLPQQHLNGLSPLPLTKLTIFYLRMQAEIHGLPSTTDIHGNPPRAFKLDVCIPSMHHAISGARIRHIFSPLHLLSVTSLMLYSGSLSIDWSPTLVMLQSVEEISVLSCKWNLFVCMLSTVMPVQAQHAIRQGVQMPCPCLCRLQFTHPCDLHCCEIADTLFLESLTIVLDMRRTDSVSVEEVVIQGKHVSLKELRTLKMMKHGEVWGNSAHL
ncbi:hypothetical protein EWM64_g8528 [Hericium alpestre]|uniref:Uncharacterized protein n=1 Tax=Hericium alpestre TaxID=135208 RepID=A0A4Y9ZMJ6_9AGAM|nr:hypothetical protein EWM64_g8528 [Hericium alpestre]